MTTGAGPTGALGASAASGPLTTAAVGADDRFVSTGTLPDAARVQTLVDAAHTRFAVVDTGTVSRVYPALETVAPDLFRVAVAGTGGAVFTSGDARRELTMAAAPRPGHLPVRRRDEPPEPGDRPVPPRPGRPGGPTRTRRWSSTPATAAWR